MTVVFQCGDKAMKPISPRRGENHRNDVAATQERAFCLNYKDRSKCALLITNSFMHRMI